jgi:hypothetical protein
VTVLIKVGDQLPLIPLLEVKGKGDKTDPEQMGATWVKVGVIVGLTVMV